MTSSSPPAVRRVEPTDCRVVVDGVEVDARAGETVAATLLATRGWIPFQCGMGTCFSCAVTIDGRAGRRACVELTRPGMVIVTVDAG
jgi:ferredoxin